MSERHYWMASVLVSAALAAWLVWLWQHENRKFQADLREVAGQLESAADTERYLRRNYPAEDIGQMKKIETGLYIQSLEFSGDVDVKFTGYVWQVYRDPVDHAHKPAPGEIGFILPDQVNSGTSLRPRLDYHLRQGDEELFGWYVEATLRQPFEYGKFPFDHKIVGIRIWHKDFSTDVISVPDFDAYGDTGTDAIFGIKENIVTPRWTRENTFFNYRDAAYSTNFGIRDFVIGVPFPDLHYNFVLKRNLVEALIEYVLILLVIAVLLFVTLLIVSRKPGQAEAHGFDTATIIASCSALFFVAILSHIELRDRFPGTAIVFLEYFFYLLYVALVCATLDAYLFSLKQHRSLKLIHYRDNLLPKVLYWPALLGASVAITLIAL